MHIYILGISGTFMGGIAQLASAMGHKVTGSDANVYSPMSTQLEALGIDLVEGYGPEQLEPAPDCVIVYGDCANEMCCLARLVDLACQRCIRAFMRAPDAVQIL